jgi:hypothetical protein
MQKFKNDDIENKFIDAGSPILDQLSMAKDDFFDGCYDTGPLGDLLHQGDRSPLSNAIDLAIFRTSFNTIYQAFIVSGCFESYLTVFRKIFGDDVEVDFTVPAPGKLTIDIVAQHLEESEFIARHIVEDEYIFDEVVYYDDDGTDSIIFQSIKGFKTQYELEQMLFEMVPAGIFTDINLTFGV